MNTVPWEEVVEYCKTFTYNDLLCYKQNNARRSDAIYRYITGTGEDDSYTFTDSFSRSEVKLEYDTRLADRLRYFKKYEDYLYFNNDHELSIDWTRSPRRKKHPDKKRTFFENLKMVNDLAKVRKELRNTRCRYGPVLTPNDTAGVEEITFWSKLKMMWRLQGLPSSRGDTRLDRYAHKLKMMSYQVRRILGI